MKKIFISLFAVAALAACTKSEVQYEPAGEIGFAPVSKLNTKAAVTTTDYPTTLDMFVFAQTDDADVTTANYLDNARFGFNTTATNDSNNQEEGSTKNLWAGEPNPYYWPNVKKLYFAGVSEAGNVNATTDGSVPAYLNGTITLEGYKPGNGTTTLGDNDLMWFPKTTEAYGKGTKYVPVSMKHACSWITIKLAGDTYTANNYTVTNITINGLTTKGNATLATEAAWVLSTADEDLNQNFVVYENTTGKALSTTATAEGFENIANNTIVLPNQVPGTLSITYKYTSQANQVITETVTGSLKFDNENPWVAGTHYTYTVTIGATQILIAPDVTQWTESDNHTVTIQ